MAATKCVLESFERKHGGLIAADLLSLDLVVEANGDGVTAKTC
jgi:hypothetical protein